VLAFHALEQLVKTPAGLDERRLRRQPGQEIERTHRLGKRPARSDRAFEQLRGTRARGGHVDVRIGAIGDETVRVFQHRARDIRMQVEARDDRHARTDDSADTREDLAFAVVEMLGDHRAMQVEIDAVDRARLLQAC
jgi:hypothetical protein